MSIVTGIDYSVLEEFRETVKVKFNENTCELPLILAKDAGIAEIYYSKMRLLESKYALLMVRREQIAELADKGKEDSNVIDADGFKAIYAMTEESEQLLDKMAVVAADAAKLSQEILKFIKPYLINVFISENVSVYSLLEKATPSKINSTFVCMLLGSVALKKQEEQDTEESEKNQVQG